MGRTGTCGATAIKSPFLIGSDTPLPLPPHCWLQSHIFSLSLTLYHSPIPLQVGLGRCRCHLAAGHHCFPNPAGAQHGAALQPVVHHPRLPAGQCHAQNSAGNLSAAGGGQHTIGKPAHYAKSWGASRPTSGGPALERKTLSVLQTTEGHKGVRFKVVRGGMLHHVAHNPS